MFFTVLWISIILIFFHFSTKIGQKINKVQENHIQLQNIEKHKPPDIMFNENLLLVVVCDCGVVHMPWEKRSFKSTTVEPHSQIKIWFMFTNANHQPSVTKTNISVGRRPCLVWYIIFMFFFKNLHFLLVFVHFPPKFFEESIE